MEIPQAVSANWHKVALFAGQIIIAGLIATGNGRLTTPTGQSVGEQSLDNAITLQSIDAKLTGIDARSKANAVWIHNFVRQHPEAGSQVEGESPNEQRKGGEK